ncbi:hypothetical protein [Marinomonas sp. THO17]|uniref:hypothetical protein n=1 Tax=Marinomonas sp. THO17 TaxID=3149048 RepID=UPI00336C1559
MSKRLGIILTLLIVVTLAGFMYNFVERYDEEIDKGWSAKAQQNPYLALELLSNKRSIPVFAKDNLQDFGDLDEYDTLYIAESSLIVSDQNLSTLLKWVEEGGFLIVSTTSASDARNDRLMSFFNFNQETSNYNYFEQLFKDDKSANDESLQHGETDQKNSEVLVDNRTKSKEEEAKEQIKIREATHDVNTLTNISFEGMEEVLKILFDKSVSLNHPGFNDENWHSDEYQLNSWSGNDSAVTFAQLNYGNGVVSIMAGNTVWQSDHIDLFDHAYFWLLMSGQDKTGILYGANMPSLFSIMKKYLPEMLYSSFALLFIWLWWRMKRFGPTRELDIQTRRSYSEHIIASAGFFWRRHWQDKLLEPLRNSVMSLAEARIAGFDLADTEAKYLMLSKQSGLSASQVHHAFENKARLNQDLFINTVQVLQRIRESL